MNAQGDMGTGDRVRYRRGTGPAENGLVVAATNASTGDQTIDILLDTGARIRVGASKEWEVVGHTSQAEQAAHASSTNEDAPSED